MNHAPEAPGGEAPRPENPADTRIELHRELILLAVARYEEARRFVARIESIMSGIPGPDELSRNETRRWEHFYGEADSALLSAETSLAERIEALHVALVGPIEDGPDGYPVAFRSGDWIYLCEYAPERCSGSLKVVRMKAGNLHPAAAEARP